MSRLQPKENSLRVPMLLLAMALNATPVRAQESSVATGQTSGAGPDGFSFYIGAGSGFGLSSLRLGYGGIEAGKLCERVAGVAWRLGGERWFGTLQVGVITFGSAMPGVGGSVGHLLRLFGRVYLRLEGTSFAGINGDTSSSLLAGADVRF